MRHGTAALSAAVAAVSLSSAATQNVKKHGVRWQPIVAARTARGSEGEGVGELFFKQLRGLPHVMLIELTATASSIKYHAENKKRKTVRTEGDDCVRSASSPPLSSTRLQTRRRSVLHAPARGR